MELFSSGDRANKTTYFFIPFSKVSRTSVEASLIYVLVDVPLIPDASLKLDRRDCSGTDKCATRKEAALYQGCGRDKGKRKKRKAKKANK